MVHRVIRIASLLLGSAWLLASCLAQGPSSVGGPAGGAGNGSGDSVTPSGGGPVADDTSAEPKPFPSGVASPGVDIDDPDAEAIAHSEVRGSYSAVCHGGERSRYQVDGEIVTTWENGGGESCFPMFTRKLVSVVTVDGEEHWSQHPVENCKFSHVITAPEFGPRKFYLVKCDGLTCRPKDGDLPIPSPDFKASWMAKVPTPCLDLD